MGGGETMEAMRRGDLHAARLAWAAFGLTVAMAVATRLLDEDELDALSRELGDVVRKTMQPAHASLWLRVPEGHR